ncbi:baseplate J/gp47 family protein [Secundilactobacillus kimchicus]|uniref:baseplate J/gp47 family protein n=1 Tax=Secundilactobacillus kimchicus TaxID=528209 RepID=UPI0024A9BD80|nr:baseplate J/gp47 family protein [Secundilactobacillus kimchicus]
MTPNDLIAQFEAQDFDFWLNLMLNEVSDKLNKREGSIIYDAMAPAATMLAESSLERAQVVKQVWISTSDGEFLDLHASDKGTARQAATFAQVTAKWTDSDGKPINNVEIGDRFAQVGDAPIFYTVVKVEPDGTGLLLSESDGVGANSYIGQILPVTPNDSLSWAEITEVSIPARATESDEDLRARLLSGTNYIAYGGSVSDYIDMMAKIDTIGAGQVYPTWQGGGTVKLVILDNDLKPASSELIEQVQEAIDPAPQGEGYGLSPIDHVVTVVAPDTLKVDITSTVEVASDTTLGAVTEKIKTAIANYFHSLSEKWDTVDAKTGRGYAMTVYRSQILAEMMKVEGVTNATLPVLNGQEEDFILQFTDEVSQLPVVGEVTLNA